MTKHWLHSVNLKVEIQKESECSKCIHKEVCDYAMEKRCENYLFGTSEFDGCHSCTNRFIRWDSKQPIPCFHCSSFIDVVKLK